MIRILNLIFIGIIQSNQKVSLIVTIFKKISTGNTMVDIWYNVFSMTNQLAIYFQRWPRYVLQNSAFDSKSMLKSKKNHYITVSIGVNVKKKISCCKSIYIIFDHYSEDPYRIRYMILSQRSIYHFTFNILVSFLFFWWRTIIVYVKGDHLRKMAIFQYSSKKMWWIERSRLPIQSLLFWSNLPQTVTFGLHDLRIDCTREH